MVYTWIWKSLCFMILWFINRNIIYFLRIIFKKINLKNKKVLVGCPSGKENSQSNPIKLKAK
jgi:hypothetical protein